MMPTFPSLPLKFRKSSFPRYGFKAGISGRAYFSLFTRVLLFVGNVLACS